MVADVWIRGLGVLDAAHDECQPRVTKCAHHNPELAKRYLERACKLGNQAGCDGLAGKASIAVSSPTLLR